MKSPLHAHLWDRHPDDWYVEPKWCSQRLFAVHPFFGAIHDPACGTGRIVQAARDHGYIAAGADKVNRSKIGAIDHRDFFANSAGGAFDNIVSNPPFSLCDSQDGLNYPFVQQCLAKARKQVALLLPSKWLSGDKRSRWLEQTPLFRVLHITPRPSMPPGPVIEAGIAPGGGKEDYAWLIWRIGYDSDPTVGWCRRDE